MIMDVAYPRLIEYGFAGIPSNVDAAFVWSGNGKIYFTKVLSGEMMTLTFFSAAASAIATFFSIKNRQVITNTAM